MKKNRGFAIVLAGLLGAISIFSTPASAIGQTGIVLQQKNTSEWPTGEIKGLACDSAIVMELSTGTILYQKKMHKQHYPASITKIMTAMLTAENASMDDTITVSQEAAYGIEAGSSTVFSEPGEKLSVEQCLYAIMLESANEVCLAAAEYISGDVSSFVDKMNARVAELGLQDTHFNNPNGLPDPKHYTSAHDMAVIARQAMTNDTFRKVCNTKSYTCPKTNKHKDERIWLNHHQMINSYQYPKYSYKYCIGGKTGFTQAAGNTLVTYAQKDGMELVCVIMKSTSPKYGEPNEYTDTTKLLNYGFEKFQKVSVKVLDDDITEDLFNIRGGYFDLNESPLRLRGEECVVLPKGVDASVVQQEIKLDSTVSLADGENVIGKVTYTYDEKTVGASEIIYVKSEEGSNQLLGSATQTKVDNQIKEIKDLQKQDARKASVLRNIKHMFQNIFSNKIVRVTVFIIGVLLGVFALVLVIRHVKLPRLKMSRRGRVAGGYRTRRGRRIHARNQRRARRESRQEWGNGKSRRRNGRHRYEKTTARSPKKKKSAGVRYYKKHKNTKESFGKNFFDF